MYENKGHFTKQERKGKEAETEKAGGPFYQKPAERKKNRTAGIRSLNRGNRKRFAIIAAAVLGTLTAVGAIYAAFSAIGTAAENTFTLQAGESEGRIENDEKKGTGVVETEWPKEDKDGNGIPDQAENLQPGAVVPKNPKFVSPLTYDAWIAMKVEVPVALFQLKGEEEAAVHDCVTLKELNQDQKWELLYEKQAEAEGEKSVYYYAYKETIAAKAEGAEKGGETGYLFQSIQVPDIISLPAGENGIGFSGSVSVTPYALQAEGYETALSAKEMLLSLADISAS